MPNKLKEIFSDSTEVAIGKITFADKETAKAFTDALETVYKEGKSQVIPKFKSFKMAYVDGGNRYPMGAEGEPGEIIIGPSIKKIHFPINTCDGKRVITLNQFETETAFITFNDKKQPFYFEFTVGKNSDRGQFTYGSNIKSAKSIEDIYRSFEEGYGVFNSIFQEDASDENVERTRKYLIQTLNYYKRVIKLKETLGLSITPETLFEEKDEELLCEQLYFMICEKKTIRSNKRLNSITDVMLTADEMSKKMPKDSILVASFIQKWECELFENIFSVYTVNFVFNVAVEKSEMNEKGDLVVYFKDASPEKMYIATTGFLTEEQANYELEHIMDKVEQYKNAKTIMELLNEI